MRQVLALLILGLSGWTAANAQDAPQTCPADQLALAPVQHVPAILSGLQKLPEKDEYETTQAYAVKVATALEAYGLKVDTPVAFQARFEAKAVSYDADHGTLIVAPRMFAAPVRCWDLNWALRKATNSEQAACTFDITDDDMPAVELTRQESKPETYEATTRMGVSVTVVKERLASLGLVDTRYAASSLSYSYSPLFQKVQIHKTRRGQTEDRELDEVAFGPIALPPEKAKEFKERGSVRVIFRLRPPLFAMVKDSDGPDLNNPIDRVEQRYLLIGQIDCVALYDGDGTLLASREVR